jgi:hypothetical protein
MHSDETLAPSEFQQLSKSTMPVCKLWRAAMARKPSTLASSAVAFAS